jgi:hypothetical protein
MALAELKRLKAKHRRGDATEAEQERYRELTVQLEEQPARHPSRGLSLMDSVQNCSIMDPSHNVCGKRKFEPACDGRYPPTGSNEWQRKEAVPYVSDEASQSSCAQMGKLLVATSASGLSAGLTSCVKKPSALVNALRASKATRGQQQHLVKALHASPTTSKMLSRISSALPGPSSESSLSVGNAPHPQHNESSLVGRPPAEGGARYHSLAGMEYSAAMLSQALPPAMSAEAFNSTTSMSTTHLLRRFGNPHRRVVHQMLREQHERILADMKRNARRQSTASSSGTDSQGDDAAADRSKLEE